MLKSGWPYFLFIKNLGRIDYVTVFDIVFYEIRNELMKTNVPNDWQCDDNGAEETGDREVIHSNANAFSYELTIKWFCY